MFPSKLSPSLARFGMLYLNYESNRSKISNNNDKIIAQN